MWFYYRLLQINNVPFQYIFYSCSTRGTEAHLQGCSAISCVVSENKMLYPISIDFLLIFHTAGTEVHLQGYFVSLLICSYK